jgi:cytochrome b561
VDIGFGLRRLKYGRFTRILHTLIAIGITLELVSSLVLRTPRPGRVLTPLQSFGYQAHETIGMAVLAVLILHWVVFVNGHAHKGIGHFFPWFSRARRIAVLGEVRELLTFKVGDPEQNDSLAGAIEGLGLLVGSILAVSGAVLFFGIAENGVMSRPIHTVKEFHEFWGPVMWTYLCIHAGAAMLHPGLGHRSVLSIFKW